MEVNQVLGRIAARLLENEIVEEVSIKKDFMHFKAYVISAHFGHKFVSMKITATEISMSFDVETYAYDQMITLMGKILEGEQNEHVE